MAVFGCYGEDETLNQSPSGFRRESRFNLLDAGNRHGRDAFPSTDKTETFVGGGLKTDALRRNLQRFRQSRFHRLQVRADFGASAMSEQSMLTMASCLVVRIAWTRRKISWLSIPLIEGSVFGKWWPISFSPAAPRSASAIAWVKTSASE